MSHLPIERAPEERHGSAGAPRTTGGMRGPVEAPHFSWGAISWPPTSNIYALQLGFGIARTSGGADRQGRRDARNVVCAQLDLERAQVLL